MRDDPLAENGDRALAVAVEVDEPAALPLAPHGRKNRDAELLEPLVGAAAVLVVAERRKEVALPGELDELDSGHGTSSTDLLPPLRDVDDLSGVRHARDARELDPLDMSDDGDAGHRRELCPTSPIWQTMVRSGLLRVAPTNASVLRLLLSLMLLPGVFLATWLVGDEHKRHQRAEARALVAQLADAEDRLHARTGAYSEDVARLVDEARARPRAQARHRRLRRPGRVRGDRVREALRRPRRLHGLAQPLEQREISASPPRGASGHSSTRVHQYLRGVPG